MTVPARRPPHRGPRALVAALGAAALVVLVGAALGAPSSPAPEGDPLGPRPDPSPTVAVEGGDGPLDAPMVDLALLPPGGFDGAPRLLTVAEDRLANGPTHLTVLERGRGRWSPRAAATDEPPILGRTSVPWLVALDERRFVLITLAPDRGETWLRSVTWTGEELRFGRRASVPRPTDAAGTADVDGDGNLELILAEARTRRGGGTCRGSRLKVLSAPDLRLVNDITVPDVRIAQAAVADVDGAAGDELVTAAYRNCPAGPADRQRLALAAIRLRDGELLLDRGVEAADPLAASSGRPAIRDVDADGHPEVLLGGARGLVVVEPARDWLTTELAPFSGLLLDAVESGSAGPAARVGLLTFDGVALVEVRRAGDRWQAHDLGRIRGDEVGEARVGAAEFDVRAAAIRAAGPAGWLDGARDCPTLVVALALVPCEGPARPGPAWFATRPVARLPGRPERLLVAQTVAWPDVPARLAAPSPLALERPGAGWRHGPSETFDLTEADAAGLLEPDDAPPAPASFAAGERPTLAVDATGGHRVVAALGVIGAHAEAAPLATSGRRVEQLLTRTQRQGHSLRIARAPSTGGLTLALPVARSGTAAATAWNVEVASIGPLGDVSPVTTSRVVVDRTPPAVVLDEAFVRPPWPFAAPITGAAEPGARVTDGRSVAVSGEDGRFRLDARLPPWPQRVDVRARDGAGNEATASLDVVGGPDLRRLPWVPILVVTIVGGAALGGLRTRRSSAHAPPDGPVLEELDPRRLQ